MGPITNNVGWDFLSHSNRAPTHHQQSVSISRDELLNQYRAGVCLGGGSWIMFAHGSLILQVHADAAPVVAIQWFEHHWIPDFGSSRQSRFLIPDLDGPRNRNSRVAHQSIGQIFVECNVCGQVAFGGDVWRPDMTLIPSVSELQQRAERPSSASELHALAAVIEALHRDVAPPSFRNQRTRARPITEACGETGKLFQLAGKIKLASSIGVDEGIQQANGELARGDRNILLFVPEDHMAGFICRLCRQTSLTVANLLPGKVLQLNSYMLGNLT